MSDRRDLEERITLLEQEVARLKGHTDTGARVRASLGLFGLPAHDLPYRGLRKRAGYELFGLPAYDIALGPDFEKGEFRGHAKGFVAIGDMATGVFAIGGLARGLVALGGLAVGGVTFGGLSIGLGLAIGGLAIGSLAFGGGAAGGVAVGGGAFGYYAAGGGAAGKYVLSAARRDPEAEEFFRRYHLPVPDDRRRERPSVR